MLLMSFIAFDITPNEPILITLAENDIVELRQRKRLIFLQTPQIEYSSTIDVVPPLSISRIHESCL